MSNFQNIDPKQSGKSLEMREQATFLSSNTEDAKLVQKKRLSLSICQGSCYLFYFQCFNLAFSFSRS